MRQPVETARGPANHNGDVAADKRGLVLAALLASLAGIVDAIGFLHLNGLFISFMSGNSTQFAVAVGHDNLAQAGVILLMITATAGAVAEPMVFAIGAMNAAMHRAGNIPVSLTFVTGTWVRFGQGLGDFLARRVIGWTWAARVTP